jgi:lysophospholipase
MNDISTIKDLVYGNGDNLQGWMLDLALAVPDGANVFSKNNQEWYSSVFCCVVLLRGSNLTLPAIIDQR